VEPIYLVLRDAALRSSLSARLGLSGHLIVALQDMETLTASRPNANGLFVLESDLLSADQDQWSGMIEPMLPCARCLVLVADEPGTHDTLEITDRRGALPAIEMMIARIEGRQIAG
jgi:hypothetical protein